MFNDEVNYAFSLRCWERWFFIECAVKELMEVDFNGVEVSHHAQRHRYTIKLDPDVISALDLRILEEKRCVLSNNKHSSLINLNHLSRNRYIEYAICKLIKNKT